MRLGNGLECYYCLSDYSDHYGECNAEQPGSVVQCSNDPDMEHYGDVCSVALTSELLFAAEHSKLLLYMYVHKYSHQYVYLYLFKQRGNIRKKKNGGDGIVINPQMVSLDVRMMTARMEQ